MAGDPAPLAAVQAAVLKTAAGKQSQQPPAQSTQVNAVAQDLAVMADQARGYTEGVNAGTIVAQDNRAAQARRLAAERAQADAARQRQLELEQRQTEIAQLRAQSERQSGQYQIEERKARLAQRTKEAETEIDPEWEANALGVVRHAKMNRGPRFQTAITSVLSEATNPDEAVALLRNAQRHPEEFPWAPGIQEDVLRNYATEYFRALEGGAVRRRLLDPKKGRNKRAEADRLVDALFGSGIQLGRGSESAAGSNRTFGGSGGIGL